MGLDGNCPECGSDAYHRTGNREVVCEDCGFTYEHLTDVEVDDE